MLLCESKIQKKKGRKREENTERAAILLIFREFKQYLLQMAEDVNDGVADGLERRGAE